MEPYEEHTSEPRKEPTPIEDFNQNLKEYLATRYELTVLKTSQKVSIIASFIMFGSILAILGVLFLLFICLAGGFWLSTLVGSYELGFLILSGIFLLFGIILYAVRKKYILTPLRNRLIKEMFDED